MPGARTTRVTRPRTTDVNPPTAETRPAKRSRRTRTTEPSHLSTPPRDVVANESTWNDTAETAGETDKNGGTDGELSDQESLPHALPLDPALLDEEDAPAAPNSSADGPKPRRGGYAGGYDARKSFGGQLYSGMSVGSSHTWQYDPGEWRETKEEPDLWQIDFEVAKHRKRRAPEGSGAPVGTEYHWFIVAHQYVKKVDANTYTTHLTGHKYKLAHKNALSASWSLPKVKQQRERELFLLEDAKRRVEGLPPVLGSEKARVPVGRAKAAAAGQRTIDSLFAGSSSGGGKGKSVIAGGALEDSAQQRKRDADRY